MDDLEKLLTATYGARDGLWVGRCGHGYGGGVERETIVMRWKYEKMDMKR